MDQVTERRLDAERERLGDRVIDFHRLDLERTGLEGLAGLEERNRDFSAGLFIFALGFKHASGEGGRIDRDLEERPELCERAIMVFVRVGYDDGLERLPKALDIGNVWQHQIRSRQVGTGERHANIHNDIFALGR